MAEEKPQRLQFKTYIQMIRNSVSSGMFRNWYIKTAELGEFDAMKGGEDSCAFYVSGLLKIFSKINSIHGTVASTAKDLIESGWQEVNEPKPGDVLIWEAQQFGDKSQRHIGFYIGDQKAVSTSWTDNKAEQIFRMENWDDDA
jgi:uncharacterized protein YfaT (DUF1175 family)